MEHCFFWFTSNIFSIYCSDCFNLFDNSFNYANSSLIFYGGFGNNNNNPRLQFFVGSVKDNSFIYIGCKIFNKSLFKNHNIKNFSILEVWKELRNKNQLYGYKSLNKFYHLTNLETFKKLKDL